MSIEDVVLNNSSYTVASLDIFLLAADYKLYGSGSYVYKNELLRTKLFKSYGVSLFDNKIRAIAFKTIVVEQHNYHIGKALSVICRYNNVILKSKKRIDDVVSINNQDVINNLKSEFLWEYISDIAKEKVDDYLDNQFIEIIRTDMIAPLKEEIFSDKTVVRIILERCPKLLNDYSLILESMNHPDTWNDMFNNLVILSKCRELLNTDSEYSMAVSRRIVQYLQDTERIMTIFEYPYIFNIIKDIRSLMYYIFSYNNPRIYSQIYGSKIISDIIETSSLITRVGRSKKIERGEFLIIKFGELSYLGDENNNAAGFVRFQDGTKLPVSNADIGMPSESGTNRQALLHFQSAFKLRPSLGTYLRVYTNDPRHIDSNKVYIDVILFEGTVVDV